MRKETRNVCPSYPYPKGNNELIDLRKALEQKQGTYNASLVHYLKGIFESGQDGINITDEIKSSRETSAGWKDIAKIKTKLGTVKYVQVFGNLR